MQSLKIIATKLNNTYWTGDDKNTVYGIFLWSFDPIVNTDYPFQLVFRFFSPGYKYIADTVQLRGGIAMNGQFTYGNGIFGILKDENTIQWSNGSIWNRVINIPQENHLDKYSTEAVKLQDQTNTNFIKDRMNLTYPLSNQFAGM